MRVIALLLLLVAGCAGPSGVTETSTLEPEWPEFEHDRPEEPAAPEWVEIALEAEKPGGLVETEASVFLAAYQHTFSRVDGPTCRFRPTCSGFAHHAVVRHGALGVVLAFGRLQRAHTHDRSRYAADGRYVVDEVTDHTFWFAPTGEPRWKWHEQVESSR